MVIRIPQGYGKRKSDNDRHQSNHPRALTPAKISTLFEKFRMGTQPDQPNLVFCFIKPNKQRVTFNMAFHESTIFSYQHMRLTFFWNNTVFFKLLKYLLQLCYLLRLVLIPFKIFLELLGYLQLPHTTTISMIPHTSQNYPNQVFRDSRFPLHPSLLSKSPH